MNYNCVLNTFINKTLSTKLILILINLSNNIVGIIINIIVYSCGDGAGVR